MVDLRRGVIKIVVVVEVSCQESLPQNNSSCKMKLSEWNFYLPGEYERNEDASTLWEDTYVSSVDKVQRTDHFSSIFVMDRIYVFQVRSGVSPIDIQVKEAHWD